MMRIQQTKDSLKLLKFSLLVLLGRRYFLLFLMALVWPFIMALITTMGWYNKSLDEAHVQNLLLGVPLYILAIGIGIRVIASEIEQRTLEVAYTIPAGAQKVWIHKLFAATLLLLCAELILAPVIWVFFSAFPITVLYGALQGAIFYLVLAMLAGVLLKNELTAILVTLVFGFFNFKNSQSRWSPLFNPLQATEQGSTELFAWTVQNHVGFALLIVAIAALAFALAQRREKLLG